MRRPDWTLAARVVPWYGPIGAKGNSNKIMSKSASTKSTSKQGALIASRFVRVATKCKIPTTYLGYADTPTTYLG